MILSAILLAFALLHHYDNRCELETSPAEITDRTNFCEESLGGICVLEHSCDPNSIIPTPLGHKPPSTCPDSLAPDRTIVCCKQESPKPCRTERGRCMESCAVPARKPSSDCPKNGKMCCV